MNKIVYLFFPFVVYFGLVNIKAQEYIPFPQDSAEWYVVYSSYYPFPPYFEYSTDHYITSGDTLINGVDYSRFYRIGSDSILYYQGSSRTVIDSSRVYYIDEYQSSESLIYDYQLKPGDTMIGLREYICIDTGTMILNNGLSHKYQIMLVPAANDCYQTWIEGIGSLGIPLLESYWGCASTFETERHLTCFFYKDEQIYQWDENPYFEGCVGTNVRISELNKYNSITLYPNPASTIAYIKVPYKSQDIFKIVCHNSYGSKIPLHIQNIDLNSISINVGNLPNGIYFIRIETKTKNSFVKLLISH